MSYSIKLLTDHKQTLERDLQKSKEYLLKHPNHLNEYNTHKRNLEPKIRQLEIDINKLK